MHELKAEIQELRAQLNSECSNSVYASSMMIEHRAKPIHLSPTDPNEAAKEIEVQVFKKQVHQLKQQLAVMSVEQSGAVSHAQLLQYLFQVCQNTSF